LGSSYLGETIFPAVGARFRGDAVTRKVGCEVTETGKHGVIE
jgi:hypothetical protein